MSKRQTFEHLVLSNCSFINIFALTFTNVYDSLLHFIEKNLQVVA